MLTVQRMKRVEIWGGLQCAGGQRIAFLAKIKECVAHVTLAGDDHLTVSVPLNDLNVPELICGRILRVWQDDVVWDEWVITEDARQAGNGLVTVTAAPPEYKLSRADPLGQVDGLGVVRYDIDVVALTPAEHLNLVLIPWLQLKGIAWVSVGTVESIAPVDISVAWESPLDVARKIAAAAALEFQFRRNGTAGYKIDLLLQIGSTAPQADFRLRKNLIDTGASRSSNEQATRVYPRGTAVDAEYATMGEATWVASVVAGAAVTLADAVGGDGPIGFDDQLNGLYLERPNGARILINDSTAATQQLALAAGGVVVGELVKIRADLDGTQLTALDSPADIGASGGVLAAVVDAGDVPSTNNLLPNPALRVWPGALPTGWTKIGGGTVTKHVTPPEIGTGPSSLLRVGVADGDGVLSPVALLYPTADRPYFSANVSVWVDVGQVRVELVVTKADLSTVVLPISPALATSTVLGQFDALGIAGEDLNALTAVSAQLRVVQHGATAATFYLDSAQVTQSASHQPFIEGSGGARLWQLANERLRTNGAPLVSYTSSVLDRARLDPVTYGDDCALVLGGAARVTDPRILATPVTTRVSAIDRTYTEHGKGAFVLSNNPDDLTGGLTRPKRPPRVPPEVSDTGALAYTGCHAEVIAATDDQVVVEVRGTAPIAGLVQVRLTDLNGATKLAGPAVGVLSPSGQQWTFARPAAADIVQVLIFESVAPGSVTDPDLLQIPAQGQGIVASMCVITPTGTTATTISFSVTADDPANGGSNVTLEVASAVGVTSPTPSPVIAAGPFSQAYTVTRPVFGNGMGRVVFRTTCAGHVPGIDAIDIPPQDRDTQSCVVSPTIIAETISTITVQVDATSPGGGTPVVKLLSLGGSATLNSGAAIGTNVASGSQWVLNRGAFQSGPGDAVFRASLASFENADKSVQVPEKLQDNPGSLVAEVKGADVVLNFSGPSTCGSWRYAVSASSMPSDGSAAAGTVVAGRQPTVTISNVVPNYGDRYYIKGISYTDGSGGGMAGPSVSAEVQRQGGKKLKTMRGFWQAAGWKSQSGPIQSIEFGGSVASLVVTGNNTPYNARLFPPIPDRAIVKETRVVVFRGNANAAITHTLYRVPTGTAGSFTIIGATRTSTSTGSDETLINGSLNEDTTGLSYAMEVTLQKGAADASSNAKALTWEIDYESADTDVTN